MGEIRGVDGPKILPRGYGKTLPHPPAAYEWEARPYVFHEFPKAMKTVCTQVHIDNWRRMNNYTDPRSGKVCYNGIPPKLGTMVGCLATEEDIAAGFAEALNEEIIVNNAEDEAIFRSMHPDIAESAPIPDVRAGVIAGPQRKPPASAVASAQADPGMADIERIAEQNRLLANMLAEKRELLRQLAELDAPSNAPEQPADAPKPSPKLRPVDKAAASLRAQETLGDTLPDDKEGLIVIAQQRGMKIDRRWSVAKFKELILADEG